MTHEKHSPLPGGSVNEVYRQGDVVRRRDKGGPMLHAYLRYLERAGMAGVPRFVGVDGEGWEILTHLPGLTQDNGLPMSDPILRSEETIVQAAAFLRRLHDASAGFLPEALAAGWVNPTDPLPPETICHNDAAVWNFVFEEGRVAGLIDFDQARAGSRLWDIAWSVYGVAHLAPWLPGEPYRAQAHAGLYRRRIALYFQAYGMEIPPDFTRLVCRRIQVGVIDDLRCQAARGDPAARRNIQQGALTHYERIAAFIDQEGPAWV